MPRWAICTTSAWQLGESVCRKKNIGLPILLTPVPYFLTYPIFLTPKTYFFFNPQENLFI